MKKSIVGLVSAVFLLASVSAAAAAPAPSSDKVQGATSSSVKLLDAIKVSATGEISISAKIKTDYSAVFYDFYGEPNNDFSATWQKLINGRYVTQSVWNFRFANDGWYPGSWSQDHGSKWKLILRDKDNGSTATYTYTVI